MEKQEIINHIENHYDIKPDYLWDSFPEYAAIRHTLTEKWFGLLMNVKPYRLNIRIDHEVDIINVKCQPELIKSLTEKKYIYPAYHMNREHWISIVLEDVDSKAENFVFKLVEDSFNLTGETID